MGAENRRRSAGQMIKTFQGVWEFMRNRLTGLLLAALLCGAALAADDGGLVLHYSGSSDEAPAIPGDPTQSHAEPGVRFGVGLAKLSPPPTAACVSDAEYTEAMMGTGCDCSCEGYAKGPDRRCMVVCGIAYYACWAPDPTEADVSEASRAGFADTLEGVPPEARAAVEGELAAVMATEEWRASTRSGLMLRRADEWDQARRCAAP